jgi:hypothetical protein
LGCEAQASHFLTYLLRRIDVGVSLLQRIDEAKRHGFPRVTQIVGKRLVHILLGLFARDDGFGLHTLAAGLAALRTRSRSPSK